MKRLIFLLMSCLLFCSVAYADKRDSGPAWEPCKVFDLSALDNLPAHVQPASAVLDTSLTFDRMQAAGNASPARSEFERFHAHVIDAGARISGLRS